MIKEHIFNVKPEKLFQIIQELVRLEVEDALKEKVEDLEGYKYTRKHGNYNIEYDIKKFNIIDGYEVVIDDTAGQIYTLIMKVEPFEEMTKFVYINEYDSNQALKKLNYSLMSFIMKRRINKRFKALVSYLNMKIEEKNNEEDIISM